MMKPTPSKSTLSITRPGVAAWALVFCLAGAMLALTACTADWEQTDSESFASTLSQREVRAQAMECVTDSNSYWIEPATGQATTAGCLDTNPGHCLWLCQDGNPLDDADNCSGTLCCPGCGGATGGSDQYPCN